MLLAWNRQIFSQASKAKKRWELTAVKREGSHHSSLASNQGALGHDQRTMQVLCFLFGFLAFGGLRTNLIEVSKTPFKFCIFSTVKFQTASSSSQLGRMAYNE